MNNFIYDIPVKVYFGKDQLVNLGGDLNKYGKRVLVTYRGGSIKENIMIDFLEINMSFWISNKEIKYSIIQCS